MFDLLIGLGDFEEFKSLMLSFKEQVAGERGAASPSGPGVCLCFCARVCACMCVRVCVRVLMLVCVRVSERETERGK